MLCRLILGFFLVFDCILCSFAELTRFADREFYRDWWNSTVTAYCCLHICRLLSAVTSLLPTVCCLHLCCLLSAVTSLLPAVCCHIFAACYLLSTSVLSALCCLLPGVLCLVSSVCSWHLVLFGAHVCAVSFCCLWLSGSLALARIHVCYDTV